MLKTFDLISLSRPRCAIPTPLLATFFTFPSQDPINPVETVIVIRSLVPGGIAQVDGRLVPGDRLVFVNDSNVENATLDEAVQALKGAPRGSVRIGVAKPLLLPEIGESSTDDLDDGVSALIISS